MKNITRNVFKTLMMIFLVLVIVALLSVLQISCHYYKNPLREKYSDDLTGYLISKEGENTSYLPVKISLNGEIWKYVFRNEWSYFLGELVVLNDTQQLYKRDNVHMYAYDTAPDYSGGENHNTEPSTIIAANRDLNELFIGVPVSSLHSSDDLDFIDTAGSVVLIVASEDENQEPEKLLQTFREELEWIGDWIEENF